MQNITKDMIISDILKTDKAVVPVLLNSGMHCLGCPSSSGESLEDACSIHGIDVDNLVVELNKCLEGK